MGMEHSLPARENRMGVSQKNIVTIWYINTTSECISNRIEIMVAKRDLYIYVHSIIIFKSQKMKERKPDAHWLMNGYAKCAIHTQWTVIQPWKGRDSDRCYNTDDSWGRGAKWNKPVPKGKYYTTLLYEASRKFIEINRNRG